MPEEPEWGRKKCCRLVDIFSHYNLNTGASSNSNSQGLRGWKGHLPWGCKTKKQLKIRPALRQQSQGSTLTHCDFCLHPYCPTPPPTKKKRKKKNTGCSTSLIIREQQIKIIMRHHLSLGRMATLKGLQTVKVGEGLKTMEGSYPVWGNVNR